MLRIKTTTLNISVMRIDFFNPETKSYLCDCFSNDYAKSVSFIEFETILCDRCLEFYIQEGHQLKIAK